MEENSNIALGRQIILLQKYDICNYTISDGIITIRGSISIDDYIIDDSSFLTGVVIRGDVYLNSLVRVGVDFLKGATIYGDVYLNSLVEFGDGFFSRVLLNGSLKLNSIKKVDKSFLNLTAMTGGLFLASVDDIDCDFLDNLIVGDLIYLELFPNWYIDKIRTHLLIKGYNKKYGYFYHNNVLYRVLDVHIHPFCSSYSVISGYIICGDDGIVNFFGSIHDAVHRIENFK